MNRSWNDKAKTVYGLIKKVSEHYGGDDPVWLREYAKDVVIAYKEDLDVAIDCFQSILDGFENKIIVKRNLSID